MNNYPVTQGFPERSSRDFFIILFRQKRKIILFFLTVMLVTVLGTFLSPKIYQSDASLIVRLGRESVSLDPTATTGQVLNVGQVWENQIKTEMEILKSQDLAGQVVDSLGYKTILDGKFPAPGDQSSRSEWLSWLWTSQVSNTALEHEQAVKTLIKNLEMDNQKNSNIISLSYKTESPDLAQTVLSKIIDAFREKHIKVHRTPGSDEFFAEQTQKSQQKLAQSEQSLKELKNKTGIGSVIEQRSILLRRIGELQRGIEESASNLAASKSKVQTMGKTLSGLPKNLLHSKFAGYSGNPIDYLQQRLMELQIKEKDLRATLTENSRPVQDIRKQIAEVETMMQQEGATHNQVSRLALLSEQATVSELYSKIGALKSELASAQGELGKINEAELNIGQLERDIEIQKGNYRNYADKFSQAKIDRALEMEKISNISVVQSASLPAKPIRPRKALNMALGFFLGTFGGLGLAFMAEYLDQSFKNPEEVNNVLKLPVLAAIPRFKIEASNAFALPNVETTLPIPMMKGNTLIPVAFREYCERILGQMRVALNRSPEAPTVLAFTSCYAGEGVSSVSAFLATAMAHCSNSRVLLMDANLNHPSAHKIFRLNQTPGLAESLKPGKVDTPFIQQSSLPNLDILTSGQDNRPKKLPFDANAFSGLINLLRREYGFILIDLPAIAEGSAAIELAHLTDGLIFVIEAEQTRFQVAQQAKEKLEQVQANVLGTILNKREFYIPEWLYQRL